MGLLHQARSHDVDRGLLMPRLTVDAIKQLAEKHGVNYSTLYGRLRKGIAVEEALKPPKSRAAEELTALGETRPIREWAKRAHISQAAILRRLAEGWEPNAAVCGPPRNHPWRGKAKV